MADLPTMDVLSRRLSTLVAERDGEWSGLPIPMREHRLTIESKNPWREKIAELQEILYPAEPKDESDKFDIINTWYSVSMRSDVYVYRGSDGKVQGRAVRHDTGIKASAWLGTLGAAQVWNFDAECTAMDKLSTLIRQHMFETYVMTGTFIETSKRSGVTYLFRRCRPTLAVKAGTDGELRILSALCLHPIGYYEGTWAGSMVPSDEVISHLLLMRGDEKMFWRRANQHEATSPLAGV